MIADIRDSILLILLDVIVHPSNLEVVAKLTEHHRIVYVASERLCEEIDVQGLQALRSVSQPKAVDEVEHYLLLDLKFTLEYRAEQVQWHIPSAVRVNRLQLLVELLNHREGVEALRVLEEGSHCVAKQSRIEDLISTLILASCGYVLFEQGLVGIL